MDKSKHEPIYYVIFPESIISEGRKFIEGEKYPVYKRDKESVKLVAENGEFNLTNSLIDLLISEWKLKKVYK